MAREACLYDLPAPSGTTVHRAWIHLLGAELVCLLHQTGSYSKPRLGVVVRWRKEAQRGHLVTESMCEFQGGGPVP